MTNLRKRFLPRFSLKNIIIGVYLWLAGVLAIGVIMLILLMGQMKSDADKLEIATVSISSAQQIFAHLSEFARASRLFDQTKIASFKHERDREMDALADSVVKNENLMVNENERQLSKSLRAAIDDFIDIRQRSNITDPKQALATNQTFEEAALQIQKLNQFNLFRAESLERDVRTEQKTAVALGTGLLGAIILLVPVLWILIRHFIYIPVNNLNRALSKFPDNQLTRAPTDGAIEFQSIAQAANSMMQAICDQKQTQIRFLAGVAHDMRNPLGAIEMSLAEIKSDNLPQDDMRTMIDIIFRQTSYLSQMTGDLLDATRVESGDFTLKKTVCSLSRVLNDSIQLHRSNSTIHTIIFEGPENLQVLCDPVRISQVANNLINNAIKYSPQGGTITVALRFLSNRSVEFSVRDNGIGIETKDLKKIFQPFQRTDRTNATIPGVGLGLSVSKKIIESHGGQIRVEQLEAGGTLFVARVPTGIQPGLNVKTL